MSACGRCGTWLGEGRLSLCPACLLEAELPPPVLGGKLELLVEIGRGGMGTVWRARDRSLGRTVAVKVVAEELAGDAEARARFLREARALALLAHPHIATIHELGSDEEQSWIVMEHVAGGSLAEALPLPAGRALEVAIEVAEALAYAHRQGVVHRDIKPANILLDAEGRAKVVDFGIARILRQDLSVPAVTAPGLVPGTQHYVAPEALAGAPPDPRMDVYSLGVVLYQATMGCLPLGRFALPSPPLGPILERALCPDPAGRYAGAEELGRDLAAAREVVRAMAVGATEVVGTAGAGPPPTATTAASPAGGARDLPPEERTWLAAAALLLTVASGLVILAVKTGLAPLDYPPGTRLSPLTHPYTVTLKDGRIRAPAHFEVWPTFGAAVAVAVSLAACGLLRRHWRSAGLDVPDPGRPLPGSRWVLGWGAAILGLHVAHLIARRLGQRWVSAFIVIPGGLMLVALLWLVWVSVLEAWRTGRPLVREPRLWLGFALGLVPPVREMARSLAGG